VAGPLLSAGRLQSQASIPESLPTLALGTPVAGSQGVSCVLPRLAPSQLVQLGWSGLPHSAPGTGPGMAGAHPNLTDERAATRDTG
jgi:hypothetical protein